MATFPYLGSYGGTDTTSYKRMIHSYDDLSYRGYAKSTAKHRVIDLPFRSIPKTKRDAIESFFITNRAAEFFIYLWPETSTVDLTGTVTTGRHLARFGPDPELAFTNNSSCSYDCNLTFILLN